jgi:hypothetical protein
MYNCSIIHYITASIMRVLSLVKDFLFSVCSIRVHVYRIVPHRYREKICQWFVHGQMRK